MSAGPRRSAYDVAVIGAGAIGLACAWRSAEAGLSVLVLERALSGAGASGVAAGMLAPVGEVSFGERELLRLNLESAALWPAFDRDLAERSGAVTGYEPRGAMTVAVDRDDAEELRRVYDLQRSLELDVEWLTRTEARQLEPGLAPGIAGAILAPQDHQVDPRALVAALAGALEAAGGELLEGVEVSSISGGAGDRRLETSVGSLAARELVIAAGAWAGEIGGVVAGDAPPVRPVKGQILRLRGGGAPLAERALHSPRCYVVPRSSGEVVVGATVEERGFDARVTAGGVQRLLEAAWELLPDVGELELVETAARLRPGTPDNLPIVGRGSPDGPLWATGHYRNGILLAPLTADAVVRAIVEGDAEPLGAGAAPGRFAGSARAGASAPSIGAAA